MQPLHLFHYATRLPVQWLRDGKPVAALHASPVCASALLEEGGPDTLLADLQLEKIPPKALRFLASSLEELFFCYRPKEEDWILCGPFCRANFQENDVRRLIRSLRLRLDREESLRNYYMSLPKLSEMNIHYSALLLKQLFDDEAQLISIKKEPIFQDEIAQGLYHNTYQNRMNMFRHPPYFFEEEISKQIIIANHAHALQLLGELNALERARLADTPLRSLKNSLIGSVTLFTRASIAGGVPSDEAFTLSDTFIQLIEQQNDMASLATIEEAVLMRFIDKVALYRKSRYSALIRKAIIYIDEYLTDDLSADAVAAQVFVNPDYLSARFRQEVGETLHRFVLRRRIEEAAQFMRYSTQNIANVAAFYRFSSQSHFISVFKKYMGMTPGEYREQ